VDPESVSLLRQGVSIELKEFCRTRNVNHLDRIAVLAQDSKYVPINYYDRATNLRFLCLEPLLDNTGPLIVYRYYSDNSDAMETSIGFLDESLHKFLIAKFESLVIQGIKE